MQSAVKSALHTQVDGVSKCARYAFGPNKLHLCGPDANRDVMAYMTEGVSDPGLERILAGFNTMYPYLESIAQANHIRDPFDARVVEAYWIGNQLLEGISKQTFYKHLRDGLKLKDRHGVREFDQMTSKLPQGARMHHSFHVFNAYKRTGHQEKYHNLESMDACRISWGSVVSVDGPSITVMRKPLLLDGHQLYLGEAEEKSIMRRLEDDHSFDELQPGQWISMHWAVPCEIISDENVRWLEHYTRKHIDLANQTL